MQISLARGRHARHSCLKGLILRSRFVADFFRFCACACRKALMCNIQHVFSSPLWHTGFQHGTQQATASQAVLRVRVHVFAQYRVPCASRRAARAVCRYVEEKREWLLRLTLSGASAGFADFWDELDDRTRIMHLLALTQQAEHHASDAAAVRGSCGVMHRDAMWRDVMRCNAIAVRCDAM